MIFYYPDGDGGRRILDTGGDTYINASQQGAMIIRGKINTLEIYNHLKTLRGEVGDLWTLAFDDVENNIYSGDLLVWDGEDWQHLGTSPSRPFYSLPTASESIKGGIVIGDGFFMVGDTLNAVTETIAPAQEYSLPTASASVKGGIMIGDGLYMDGDTLNTNSYYHVVYKQGFDPINGEVKFNNDGQVMVPDTEGYQSGDVLFSFNGWDYWLIEGSSYRNLNHPSMRITPYVSDRDDYFNVTWLQLEDRKIRIDTLYEYNGHKLMPRVLPTMSKTVKGGAKNGAGLVMNGEVVSVDLRTAVETVASGIDDLLYPIVDEKFSIPNDVWNQCIAWGEYAPSESYGAYPGPPEGSEGYQINFAYSNVPMDEYGNYDTFSSITIYGDDYIGTSADSTAHHFELTDAAGRNLKYAVLQWSPRGSGTTKTSIGKTHSATGLNSTEKL